MTRIYQLAREFDWWVHLCPRHLRRWLAAGWQVRERKDPPHPITCSDCAAEPKAEDDEHATSRENQNRA